MSAFKKHPVGIYKNRQMKLSRIHALEITRRLLEGESGKEEMMADPTSMWPQMMGEGQGTPFSGTPFEGM